MANKKVDFKPIQKKTYLGAEMLEKFEKVQIHCKFIEQEKQGDAETIRCMLRHYCKYHKL